MPCRNNLGYFNPLTAFTRSPYIMTLSPNPKIRILSTQYFSVAPVQHEVLSRMSLFEKIVVAIDDESRTPENCVILFCYSWRWNWRSEYRSSCWYWLRNDWRFPKTIGSEALQSTEIRGAINRLEYSPRVCRRNFAYRAIWIDTIIGFTMPFRDETVAWFCQLLWDLPIAARRFYMSTTPSTPQDGSRTNVLKYMGSGQVYSCTLECSIRLIGYGAWSQHSNAV